MCGAARYPVPMSSRGAAASSTRRSGATASRSVSTILSVKNIRSIAAPPSTKSEPIPLFSSSVTIEDAEISSATTTSATPSSSGKGRAEKTILRPQPAVKKSDRGSSRPERVAVTFVSSGARPRRMRSARRAPSATTRRGLSRRIVPAPTRMASNSALRRMTSAQSSGLDMRRRAAELSSSAPSAVTATDAKTFIVRV